MGSRTLCVLLYIRLSDGLYRGNSHSEALEGNLVADASSGEVKTAQPSWVCQPEHLALGMELVH